MPGLVPGIHVLAPGQETSKTWMAGTSPAMTDNNYPSASSSNCFNCAWCFDIWPTAVAAEAGRVA